MHQISTLSNPWEVEMLLSKSNKQNPFIVVIIIKHLETNQMLALNNP